MKMETDARKGIDQYSCVLFWPSDFPSKISSQWTKNSFLQQTILSKIYLFSSTDRDHKAKQSKAKANEKEREKQRERGNFSTDEGRPDGTRRVIRRRYDDRILSISIEFVRENSLFHRLWIPLSRRISSSTVSNGHENRFRRLSISAISAF